MQRVTVSEPVTLGGVQLEANVPYLLPTTVAGSLLTDRRLVLCADGVERPVYRLTTVESATMRPLDLKQDYNGRKVWMFRAGGYGDLLMITPTIRTIRNRWPQCEIHFGTLPKFTSLFRGISYVTAHGGWIREDQVSPLDPLIFFEGVIEDSVEARSRHGAILFAERSGLKGFIAEPGATCQPMYHLFKTELGWARAKYPLGQKPRLGVQVAASSAVRSYPPLLMHSVLTKLLPRWEIFLFAEPGKLDCDLPGVINLADHGLDFRQSVAVLATCDVALVPDSALLHICGALRIPYVGLFASFDPALRVVPGPKTILRAEAPCAPCFHHESGGRKFPLDRPCNMTGFCTVLASISPQEIVDAVENLHETNNISEIVFVS